MTSLHDLSDDELRAELERTRSAYGDYVRDVGRHPDHSARDLDDEARRHLDVREELDRRSGGYREDVPPREDEGEELTDRLDPGEIEPYA